METAGVVVLSLNVAFVLWRMWAGGMFETGLERVLGWTGAHED
jgi:hypothetical protein